MLLLDDAYQLINGDLTKLLLLYDELNKTYFLATSDYLPSLTEEQRKFIHETGATGTTALAIYADMLGYTKDEIMKLAEKVGFSDGQLIILDDTLDTMAAKDYNFSLSDNLDVVKERVEAIDAYIEELFPNREAIISLRYQGSVEEQIVPPGQKPKRTSNSTNGSSARKKSNVISAYGIQDINAYDSAWDADMDRLGVLLGFRDKTVEGYTKDELKGNLGQYHRDNMDITNPGSLAQNAAVVGAGYLVASGVLSGSSIKAAGGAIKSGASKVASGASKVASGVSSVTSPVTSKVGDIFGSDSVSDAIFKAGMYMHADGGLSFKDHVARVSEGNMREVILPLTSQDTITALAGALTLAGAGHSGSGVTVENININNDGINIADNPQAWRKVGIRIADEISAISRERGDLNYGIK
jgi:X-X-X-Leu-X-X-Gly heptad repeat protein